MLMQEGDVERKLFAPRKQIRFLIVDPPRAISRLQERALEHQKKTGGKVSTFGTRIVRLVAVRPHVARKSVSSNQAVVLLAVDGGQKVTASSEYQLKAAEARVTGDHARAQFFTDLHHLCSQWGKFDATKIFDPDLSTPSKMEPMRIKFKPGGDQQQFHLPMRRFTPPQKDEIRKQLLKMLQHKVIERGGTDAWVSCVHLARKRDGPPPATLDPPDSAAPTAAINAIGAFMSWADHEEITPGGKVSALHSVSVSQRDRLSTGQVPATEEVVFLSESDLQQWAVSCGFGGQEAINLALTHAISADVKTGSGSPIRWRFCLDFRRAGQIP
jgi:hypothetical protein